MSDALGQRGFWAEHYVRDFLTLPFVSEFVLHSLQTLDDTQKEVADFLISYPGVGILISQKAQSDPRARSSGKTRSWTLKQARRATSQLCGALRTGRGKRIWCQHVRRGAIDLPDGLPFINHGLVLLEVLERVDLNDAAEDLPLAYEGVPITYLSLNDFLNVVLELRTAPELLTYLEARRSLPFTDLRVIGDERALFEFYLLSDGSLAGCVGKADAVITVAARNEELRASLRAKWDQDCYGGLIEDVADQLATRRKDYSVGLSAEQLARYDDPANRANYLKMQAALADLRLRERSELGRAFEGTIRKRERSVKDFTYMGLHMDSRPEWVYVLASSAGLQPQELARRKEALMTAAMACYCKTHCLEIIDRDGASYEIALMTVPSPPSSPTHLALADQLFGRLRMHDRALELIPSRP